MHQQNWHGRDHDRGRGGRSNCSNVECYNCGKYEHYANDCYVEKKVEENEIVKEDEKKYEGILMMANKGVTLDSDIV